MLHVVCAVHTGASRQFDAVPRAADLCVLECVPGFRKIWEKLVEIDYDKYELYLKVYRKKLIDILQKNFKNII